MNGVSFGVVSDHKVLRSVLKSNKGNTCFSSRLNRCVGRLLPFEFTVVHTPGRTLGNLSISKVSKVFVQATNVADKNIQKVFRLVSDRNREVISRLPPWMEKFKSFSVVLKDFLKDFDQRLVIPKIMRGKLSRSIHYVHAVRDASSERQQRCGVLEFTVKSLKKHRNVLVARKQVKIKLHEIAETVWRKNRVQITTKRNLIRLCWPVSNCT